MNASPSGGNEDKGLEPPTPKDEDPDGNKALTVTDPLEQAWKLWKPLATLSIDRVDVCLSIYDVSVRRSTFDNPVFLAFHIEIVYRKIPPGGEGTLKSSVTRYQGPRTSRSYR